MADYRFSPAGFQAFGSAMYRARTDMDATEKRAKTMSERSSRSLAAMGQTAKLVAGGGILAFGAIVASSVKKAADLEQVLNVLKETSGATGRQMERVGATAKRLGADVRLPATSAKDAADAMLELSKGGLSVKETMDAARGTLQLSAAAQIDNATAATIVAKSLNAFGLEGKEAARIADLLAAAANATTAEIPEMAQGLQQSAASAHALGIPVETLVTMLGQLANAGIDGSDAGTSVKTMLQALTPNSEKAADAMAKLNVHAFDQNERFVGMPSLISQYSTALNKLSEEERATTIETIFGSDASRAANIILGDSVKKHRDLKNEVTKSGAAADLAKAQTKGFKGAWEGFKSVAETAQISLGQRLLPVLTDGMQKASEFVASIDDADIDRVGDGIASGFGTAAQVLGDVASVGGDVAGVLIDIGQALDLGDASSIEAIAAAFVGFKVAGVVAPMVASLAGSLSTLIMNARTAPTLSAFFSSLPLLANPVTAVSLAVAGLAAGLVLLASQESAEEAAAKRSAAAKREQAAAVRDLALAEGNVAGTELGVQRAKLEHARAEQHLTEVKKTAKRGSVEYRDAVLSEREAALRVRQAVDAHSQSLVTQQTEQGKLRSKAADRLATATKELQSAQEQVDVYRRVGRAAPIGVLERLRIAQGALTEELVRHAEANSRSFISDTNVIRQMAGVEDITERNAKGFQALSFAMNGLPKKVQTRIVAMDQDAVAKVGILGAQLVALGQRKTVARILTNAPSAGAMVKAFEAMLAGVPKQKVIRILQNADSARGAVSALKGAIDALPSSKTITLTTNRVENITQRTQKFTSPAGKVELKARGGRTDGPELALIGEDGSGHPEYVVPTNPRYRGRAMHLFMQLAEDLGVSGFRAGTKKGKSKPKPHKKRWVPERKEFLHLSPEQFESDRDDKKQRLDRLEQDAKEKDSRGRLTRKALRARKDIGKAKRQLERARALAAKARSYANRIDGAQDDAEIARNAMDLADKQNDQGKYDKALGDRKGALRRWRSALEVALGFAKPGTKWHREVEKALGQVKIDVQDAGTASSQAAQDAAAAAADTGLQLTGDEQKRLDELERDVALAQLSDDLGDDRTALTALVSLREGILGRVQGAGAPADAITEAATAVRQARDDLKNLTSGGSGGVDQDLQAQLDQANERARVATQERDDNAGALRVLGSPGGRNPGQIGLVQNNYMLHPSDPSVLLEIAKASNAGNSYGGTVRSPRERVGA